MRQFFKHTLPVDDIVIRQDDFNSTFIEENVGIYYPLVRINNTTISFGDLISCELRVGDRFLPELEVSIDDSEYIFRETDFSSGQSFITIFIGNSADQLFEPIKNNYLITNVESEPGSKVVTFNCVLYVPLLYSYAESSFDGTSFDVLKMIAETSRLGFVSNITNTNDSMIWLNPGDNISWIHNNIIPGIYSTDSDSFRVYIDQYANLNLISLRNVIDTEPSVNIESNIITGEPLETPEPLVLTNNKLDKNVNYPDILYYTPINNYGSLSLIRSRSLDYTILEDDYETINPQVSIPGKYQISDRSVKTRLNNINTHDRYYIAKKVSDHNLNLLQGTKLSLTLDWYVSMLHLFMNIPIEIYNSAKISRIESQDTRVNLDNLDNLPQAEESNAHILNESLSGNAVILNMEYRYIRSNTKNPNKSYKLRQHLTVYLKN